MGPVSGAVLAISHRAPASVAAARRMADAGAGMFEIDVQRRGADVVASHYLPLPGRLRPVPVERDNWRLRRSPGADPLLRAVLDRLPDGSRVLLDPKHHAGNPGPQLRDAVLAELGALGCERGRFAVSTSDPDLLAGYRAAGLGAWRSIGDAAALARTLRDGGDAIDGVSVRHTLLDAETVSALSEITGMIAAWTVNSVGRASRLADLGVTAITTDSIAVVQTVSDVAR